MSDGRRKINKQSTGTVPKTKCRNNSSYPNEGDSSRSWTNNLNVDFQRMNLTDFLRSSRRNTPHSNYCTMNTVEEQRQASVNGSITPNSSTSRRNSSGTVPKCDNVMKYPDKKQIEDKLSQIREYLQITTSLMANMKNTDDQSIDETETNNLTQMIKDLKESEAKLVTILDNYEPFEGDYQNNEQLLDNVDSGEASSSHRNELDEKSEQRKREIELLRDQQVTLMSLQQKAENKLKDARQIQEKLLMTQCGGNELLCNKRDKNMSSLHDLDTAIKELEERSKRLKEPRGSNQNLQDKLLAEFDSLHNQIINLHNINEDRGQLIEILDNRDVELRNQHIELQTKLNELHNRKQQVDHLVVQLQNANHSGDVDDEDVGGQVRRIVAMKDQLTKLKDMLEIVKTTESVMQNTNSQEMQELACDICTKAENFLQKDAQNCHNNTENCHKQINKNAAVGDRGFGGARPKMLPSKMALQAELVAKKRELEEIMGKHKAGTSNLNHDVGNDSKSEFSCSTSNNAFFDGVPPWISSENRASSNERYSSHGCSEDDVNEYSDMNGHQKGPLPTCESDFAHQHERELLPGAVRTPERNMRNSSIGRQERLRLNSEQDNRNQVQKQLELIRSLCDSMLEQQTAHQGISVRNNLTPSPLYLEPRRFHSPSPHSLNTVNVVENPWFNGIPNDVPNQNWLTTNTLQTQAFMLNTLNQCCQMLWLQQRELVALRQTVNQMQQQRLDNPHFENASHLASPLQQSNPVETRPRSNQKINQVSAACSMPNLNHYNINVDPSYATNHNNMQTARLLDTLNNANANPSPCNDHHINNSVLHGVNANINPGQIWNGQALNNQVAPGNRANNYWDNFRSYSRQNLLSTKSNEGFHQTMERSNVERTSNPFTLMSLSKSNSESQENTPRRTHFASTNRNIAAIPPDVLNVNVTKMNERTHDLHQNNHRGHENDGNYPFYLNNAFAYNETSSNTSLISEDLIFKDCIPETTRRRNEWHDDAQDEQFPTKSKLFEELRENIYKEVANLISANEARPHFLIQLFRDLQMISSDPLRLKILQSIQTVITHSLLTSQMNNRQVLVEPPPSQINEQELNQMVADCFSLQSTVWSKSPKNPPSVSRNTLHENDNDMQGALKEIIPYLNDHEDDVIQHHFLTNVKQMLIDSQSFQETVKDSVFQKHFSNVLDEVLAQYHGKKVRDVKMHVIQTIGDLLRGELSFIQLIQETCPENCESNDVVGVNGKLFDSSTNLVVDNNGQIQNGDLAEADQGRVEDDDVEEEGAVGGGFWNLTQEQTVILTPNPAAAQVNSDEIDLAMDFQNNSEATQFIKQGLDQVPTRLPTKSRSNTPSKDRSTSRSDRPEQF